LNGYAGQILIVNLSTKTFETKPLDLELAKKYIGGIGLAMRTVYDYSKPDVDPLSPDNPLVLATGPVSGTMWPTAGNGHAFAAKSPLTNTIGESKAHGFFGAELKRAGYDMVIILGKSEKPVYLWIDDNSVQLMDATHLWGKSPFETEEIIKKELGDLNIRIAGIGLAGEKLVRIAAILNDQSRACGRCGMGAVMGSKNLKAIAVRGSGDVTVANVEGLKEFCKVFYDRAKGPKTRKYRTLGTPENVLVLNKLGALPTRNITNATFEGAEKVSGEYLNERFVKNIVACGGCPMRCEHVAFVPEGPYKGTLARMEYESLWAFGPNCGIGNLDAVIKAIDLCNFYGMDTISCGAIVGFAMDCYENKIVTKKDTGELELKFGNPEAMLQIVRKMGEREGLGDVLAEGVKRAAEKIGRGAEKLANHIKGLEMTGYDIRGLKTAALGYAVSFRGADHNRHGSYAPDVSGKVDRFKAEEGRGKMVREIEDLYTIIDSLIVCKFSRGLYEKSHEDAATVYRLITGIDMTAEEMMMAGERINNLGRVLNVREGFTRKDDTVPIKTMTTPIPDDCVSKGSYIRQKELDLLLDDYYAIRGWTKDGVPTVEKLKELGMEEFVDVVKEKITPVAVAESRSKKSS
jgi:aldehyde:ferredoxin oxidoreductase